MVPAMRQWFNNNFTAAGYNTLIKELDNKYPGAIEFRLAETPVFLDKAFTQQILDTCDSILDVITQPNFSALTKNAVPDEFKMHNNSQYSHFIAFDFGICENEKGELEPQLVEMQGFPSLFAYQVLHDEVMRKTFNIPDSYTTYLSGLNKESYLKLLLEILTEDVPVEQTILLELFPEQQKTRIDFYCTQEYLGINTVCLTHLIKEGNELFYMLEGIKTPIKRIYNRVVFDELTQQTPEVQEKGKILFEDLAVEWVPHPKWFYKISKYTLPFINHPNVPQTTFLDELKELPTDIENYVLKPLFSFAGQGVVIDLSPEDLTNKPDPHNWILQRKVKYADVIQTPNTPAKAEIRMFYFWKKGEARPIPTNNLARLSKGKMIGVRYNADKDWVGGSLAYFEK